MFGLVITVVVVAVMVMAAMVDIEIGSSNNRTRRERYPRDLDLVPFSSRGHPFSWMRLVWGVGWVPWVRLVPRLPQFGDRCNGRRRRGRGQC